MTAENSRKEIESQVGVRRLSIRASARPRVPQKYGRHSVVMKYNKQRHIAKYFKGLPHPDMERNSGPLIPPQLFTDSR